jgi:hypothetical protein
MQKLIPKTVPDDSGFSDQDREDVLRSVCKSLEKCLERIENKEILDRVVQNELNESISGLDMIIDSF